MSIAVYDGDCVVSRTSRALPRLFTCNDTLRLSIITTAPAGCSRARSATCRRMRAANITVAGVAVNGGIASESQVTAFIGLVKSELAVTHCERYKRRRR